MLAKPAIMVVAFMLLNAGCSKDNEQRAVLKKGDFSTLTQFTEAIKASAKTTVYEGLPHHFHEPEALANELRNKKTTLLHGFPFYETQMVASDVQSAELRTVLADETSFNAWAGEKLCGGFHPDYAVEWDTPKGKVRALICFGCGEVVLTMPNTTLRCDIPDGVMRTLKELLGNYKKNRPSGR